MANLAQLSNLRGSQRGAVLLARMLGLSPLLRFLDQNSGWEEQPTKSHYRTHVGSTTLGFRARGGTYTPVDKAPTPLVEVDLAIGGFQIDIDATDLADDERGLMELEAHLEEQLSEEAYNFTFDVEKQLFQANGSSDAYTGLRSILDGTTDVPGFTGQKMVLNPADALAADPDSLDLTDSANWPFFVRYLNEQKQLLENIKGWVCSPAMASTFTEIARKTFTYGVGIDQFGNNVEMFNGVPIVPLLTGTITDDEPDDHATTPATNTTSIYAMSPGERVVSVITNSGLDFIDYSIQKDAPIMEVKQSGRLRAEIRLAWKIKRPRSIRRIRNIKIV